MHPGRLRRDRLLLNFGPQTLTSEKWNSLSWFHLFFWVGVQTSRQKEKKSLVEKKQITGQAGASREDTLRWNTVRVHTVVEGIDYCFVLCAGLNRFVLCFLCLVLKKSQPELEFQATTTATTGVAQCVCLDAIFLNKGMNLKKGVIAFQGFVWELSALHRCGASDVDVRRTILAFLRGVDEMWEDEDRGDIEGYKALILPTLWTSTQRMGAIF